MRLVPSIAAFWLSLIVSAALADTSATEATNLARVQKYVGAPIENFTMWTMYKWQGLGPEKLAVWTGINQAFLLTVEQPCIRLQDARGIVVTSRMSHQVNRRLDSVNFDSQHCQIGEIRPIDYKAMLKDRQNESASNH